MHITQKSSGVVTSTVPTVNLADPGSGQTPGGRKPLFAYPDSDQGPTVTMYGSCADWCAVASTPLSRHRAGADVPAKARRSTRCTAPSAAAAAISPAGLDCDGYARTVEVTIASAYLHGDYPADLPGAVDRGNTCVDPLM